MLAGVLDPWGCSVNESVVIATGCAREFPRDAQGQCRPRHHNAITSTISRTIITPRFDADHGLCDALFFGGETLHYFALALTIGICFGIYCRCW